ncbi:type II toxin-antitoxin system death-on-curing family toxin [Mesorhizobium sp. CN5-321]|jgi:death-on-curing protein|uniref:type II toxin-antitoxin system death-on-curing family toxin n=1 Tax=Mesorhizobium hunchu TaxID=3157708 RepID=UPI0032B76DE9
MIRYHSREFVEAMHAEQLRLHGGASGVRDIGMLESALARPLNKAAYGEVSLFELAAAYLFGIVKNHPFVDGNKRTALAAADVFLADNGWSLEADKDDLYQLVVLVAAGDIDEEGATAFFGENSTEIVE